VTDPELTPDQTEGVRRLLAAARHTEPLPTEVEARLNDVLSELSAETEASAAAARSATTQGAEPAAPVISLAARRRRRRAGGLLVAAAAVTVFAVGIRPALSSLSADDSGSGAASAELAPEDRAAAGGADALQDAPSEPAPAATPESAEDSTASKSGLGVAVRLRERTFDTDVRRAADTRALLSAPSGGAEVFRAGCRGSEAWGEGTVVRVQYDGRRGALVLRAPDGDQRRADLYLCGSPAIERSVLLPAP
jgi:hypothetical protein